MTPNQWVQRGFINYGILILLQGVELLFLWALQLLGKQSDLWIIFKLIST